MQFSTAVRNGRLDSIETVCGASPKLQIRSGAAPANAAAADSGTLLCEITLPADWLTAAANGVKTKNGTWSGSGAAGAGAGTDAGHYRIKDNAGTTTHIQGPCSGAGGGAEMTLDNISIANGQAVNVATFSITDGNP